MVTQSMISFKVDSSELLKLDTLCASLGIKRNKMLNFLVFYANRMFSDSDKYAMIAAYAASLSTLSE